MASNKLVPLLFLHEITLYFFPINSLNSTKGHRLGSLLKNRLPDLESERYTPAKYFIIESLALRLCNILILVLTWSPSLTVSDDNLHVLKLALSVHSEPESNS